MRVIYVQRDGENYTIKIGNASEVTESYALKHESLRHYFRIITGKPQGPLDLSYSPRITLSEVEQKQLVTLVLIANKICGNYWVKNTTVDGMGVWLPGAFFKFSFMKEE